MQTHLDRSMYCLGFYEWPPSPKCWFLIFLLNPSPAWVMHNPHLLGTGTTFLFLGFVVGSLKDFSSNTQIHVSSPLEHSNTAMEYSLYRSELRNKAPCVYVCLRSHCASSPHQYCAYLPLLAPFMENTEKKKKTKHKNNQPTPPSPPPTMLAIHNGMKVPCSSVMGLSWHLSRMQLCPVRKSYAVCPHCEHIFPRIMKA